MIIDWYKYIKWLTPTFLRSAKLLEFMRVLIWQVPATYSDMVVWGEEAKYKANINASTISLEHAIQRTFDKRCTITTLDGKPTDFLVEVEGSVDETQLKALIETYKLAGKSYLFKLGDVVLSASWSNYVCEYLETVYTASWSDYACENDGYNYINTVLGVVDTDTYRVTVTSQFNAGSAVTVGGSIVCKDEQQQIISTTAFSVTIAAGSATNNVDVNIDMTDVQYIYIDTASLSVSPTSDDYYNYLIED